MAKRRTMREEIKENWRLVATDIVQNKIQAENEFSEGVTIAESFGMMYYRVFDSFWKNESKGKYTVDDFFKIELINLDTGKITVIDEKFSEEYKARKQIK